MEKKYIIMLRIASVVLIVLLGAIAYISLSVNPKSVFIASINNTYTQMSNVMSGLRESKFATLSREKPVSLITEVDFEFGHSEGLQELEMIAEMLEGLGINYSIEQDLLNKKLYMDFRALFEEEKILGANVFAEDGVTYFFIQEFFDHYVGVDDIDLFQEDETDVVELLDDVEILVEKTKTLFLKSLKNDYFSSEKTDITLNGEQVSVTRNTFDLDETRIKEMLEYVINGLKKDEKALESLKNIANYSSNENLSKEEIIEGLDEAIAEIPNLDLDGFEMSYSIYVKGLLNKIVKHDFMISYNDYNGAQTVNIINYNRDKINVFEFYNNDEMVLSFELLENDEETSKFGIFVYENGEQIFAIELEMKFTETEIEKDKHYESELNLNLKVTMEDDNIIFGMNAITELEVLERIYEPSRGVLIKYDDMTEMQIENMEQTLEDLFGGIAEMLFPGAFEAIDDAQKGAFNATGYGLVRAAENEHMRRALGGETLEIRYEFKLDGTNMGTNGTSLDFNGQQPIIGSIVVKEDGLVYMAVSDGTYCLVSAGNREEVFTYDEYELMSQYAVDSIYDCTVEGLNLRLNINNLHFER